MFTKMAEYLDKILMAAVAVAVLGVVVFIFRDDIPALGRKYKQAHSEAAKNHYGMADEKGKDPKGMVRVSVIKNGKVTSVLMTREERDRLYNRGR